MESNCVIVYFDGVCGLCNRFVDFLLKHDKSKSLKLAPLQTAKRKNETEINTVILSINGYEYFKSDAAIRALAFLGGFWITILLLLVIPKFLRDSIYEFVAKNRYKWFGKRDTCRIPTPEEKDRFIP
ncbi:MAG: DCC1-like thiol-disulfide oxidoreductase family protein [Bdellovibrionota bacterium]